MNRTEIMEKLEKAREAVTKKVNTLERHHKRLEKLNGIIDQSGYTLEEINTWVWSDDKVKNDLMWKAFDIQHCLEDIERTETAIEDKKKIVEKWEAKLVDVTEKERIFNSEMPAVIIEFRDKLIARWDEWDLEERAKLREAYRALGYREFMKKFKYIGYKTLHMTDEEIHKENTRASNAICINLWNRVKETVGEVTDCFDLHVTSGNEWEGCAINGIVRGTEGMCEVVSILAGGYNVQKLHIRTLVKKWKK